MLISISKFHCETIHISCVPWMHAMPSDPLTYSTYSAGREISWIRCKWTNAGKQTSDMHYVCKVTSCPWKINYVQSKTYFLLCVLFSFLFLIVVFFMSSCHNIWLSSQKTYATSSTNTILGLLWEEFSFHNNRLFGNVSASQQFVVAL